MEPNINEKKWAKFKRISHGNFVNKELIQYVGSTSIGFFFLLFISYLFYPKELNYSILTNSISSLGEFNKNPGWIFFSFAMIFAAATNIPMILHNYRKFKGFGIVPAKFGLGLFILANICSFSLAFLPNEYTIYLTENYTLANLHFQVALVMFIAWPLGIAAYGYGFSLEKKKNIKRKIKIWPAFTIFLGSVLGMVISLILRIQLNIHPYYPGILSYSLWEWIWLIGNVIAFDWITYALK
jgi:hypothetical membrane protein